MNNTIGKFKLDFKLPSDFNDKSINQNISLDVYKAEYSYKTIRGNKKENHKYIMANSHEEAKFLFFDEINSFNRENAHRAISNVRLLGTAYLGKATL